MDFDGDGILDLLSGSYDPGEVYLFRGQGNGKYAPREVLGDKSGKPILKVPEQKDRVESFGSWAALVDWDADSDLDLLVGTFEGMIFLRRNEGTRTKPAYAAQNEWVQVGSKRLRVPGGAHANPVITDWDGDGRWDLISGSSDGGVYWYRNVGARGKPAFEKPVALVPKHEGSGYSELLDVGQDPKPGIRSQIAITDYDGDGKLDVLVGDFCTYLHVRDDLSTEARKEFDAIQKRLQALGAKLRAKLEDLQGRWAKLMEGVPKSDWLTPENSAKWTRMYQEMRESADYQRLYTEYEATKKELVKYVTPDTNGADAPARAHGFVWLFRRK